MTSGQQQGSGEGERSGVPRCKERGADPPQSSAREEIDAEKRAPDRSANDKRVGDISDDGENHLFPRQHLRR